MMNILLQNWIPTVMEYGHIKHVEYISHGTWEIVLPSILSVIFM